MFGNFWGHVWEMLGHVWELKGHCLNFLGDMFGLCLETCWDLLGNVGETFKNRQNSTKKQKRT